MIRKFLPSIFVWFLLAIVLLILVPMAYPVKLPNEYHLYHFILFWVLFGVYYLNVNFLIPVIYKKYGVFSYLISIVAVGAASILFMDYIESLWNIRQLIHQKLNPQEPYVKKRSIFIYFYIILLLSVVLIAGMILQLVRKWNREEKNNILLREEKSKAELKTLKAQIQPHFFFNTLNTIYALSHSDVSQSQEALLKLSKMMRYTMNEENREKVKLQEEIEFINNYLDLMKHRLPNNVFLKTSWSAAISEFEIAPMILLTFIENCFKHGITTEKDCEINIETCLEDHTFTLKTKNDMIKNKSALLHNTGIGIQNTIKRLDILYPGNYTYQNRIEDGKYYCHLKINLS